MRVWMLALACGAVAVAQISTGTIHMTVNDTTGAVIPGAAITLAHTGTGQAREGVTNERGELRSSFMPIGDYTVTVSMQGFKRQRVHDTRVAAKA